MTTDTIPKSGVGESVLDRGAYIVFEGGDYTGKTTQAGLLAPNLGAIVVREPGSTPIGWKIRGLLLDPEVERDTKTDVLLHAAQRAELCNTVVRPAIASGRHVVSERSWVSSAAYQGASGEQFDDIINVNSYALGSLMRPDILFLLDGDPVELSERAQEAPDYYESKALQFHEQVRENYLLLGRQLGAVVIDATLSINEVAATVQETVSDRLGVEV